MVAILNVHIPLLLGNLVNVVASLQPGLPVNHYFYQLARPGAPLALYYIGQVCDDWFTVYYPTKVESIDL